MSNRVRAFASRNLKELLRDPLSYIFCLAFPLCMLIVMTLVDTSVPAEAGVTSFRIWNLTPGVAVFGQTFVMLFTALTVSKDRGSSFLVRMYASPMRSADFVFGYILPMLGIALAQAVITAAAGFVIGLIRGVSLSFPGILLCILTLLPSAVLMISLGLLFGTLFSEKAAPGLCSVLISLGSFLGGIWFDAENAGGVMNDICRCTPLLYCTRLVRGVIHLDFTWDSFFFPLIIVAGSAALLTWLAIYLFKRRMRADLA